VNVGDGTTTANIQYAANDIKDQYSSGWFGLGIDDVLTEGTTDCGKSGGVILKGEDNYFILKLSYTVNKGDCAVFVEGGYNDILQACFGRTVDYGINTFRSLGYSDNHLFKISQPSKSELGRILTDTDDDCLSRWLGRNDNLFIYIVDHGCGYSVRNDIFEWMGTKEGKVVLNANTDLLDWGEVGGWLEQIDYNICTIVIEACFSGEWISTVSSLHADNHIIITATDNDHVSYGSVGGKALFSGHFFMRLSEGDSYGRAWEKADHYIYGVMGEWSKAKSIERNYRNIMNFFDLFKNRDSENLYSVEILLKTLFKEKIKVLRDKLGEIQPLLVPAEKEWFNLDELRNYNLQSPCLSDDDDVDFAGTKGVNVKDDIDAYPLGNGELALSTSP
jgi:hypothetical protein